MSPLLVLPVLLPLIALPVGYLACQLTGCRYYGYYLTVSLINFIPLFLLAEALTGSGPIKYELGGWPFNLGVVLVLDQLALLLLFLIQFYFFLAILYSGVKSNFDLRQFFLLLFIAQAGLSGMVLTGDLFNLYVFLEVTSLSFYALTAFKRTPEGYEAGFKYLILGSCGGFMILWAIGLVYSVTGNLNLAYVAGEFPAAPVQIKVAVLGLFTAGLGLKFAIFPLHAWKVDVLTSAPDAVNLLLVGAAAKIPLYCLLRIYSLLFGWEFLASLNLPALLAPVAVATILTGHLMALRQNRLKRLLAFSSVAHVGYIFAGVATITPPGVNSALIHLVNHGVLKGGLFLITGAFVLTTGTDRIEELRGIHRQQPFLTASFLCLALGMIGLPPVNGFLSKWQLVINTMEAGFYVSASAIAAGGLLATIYYSRVIATFYKNTVGASVRGANFSKIDFHVQIPVGFLVLLSLILFFAGTGLTRLIEISSTPLFDTSPYLSAVLSGF